MYKHMHGVLRTLLIVLLLAAFGVSGCDKKDDIDDDKQKEGGTKATVEGEGAKKGGDPAKGGEAADKAKGDDAEKTAAPEAPPLAKLPKEILVYGGILSLDSMVTSVNDIVSMFAPMPGLGSMMEEQIKTGLALKDLAWLDRTKPVKFLVWQHKNMSQPFVLLVPMKDKAGFEAAMPATKKQNDAGNAWSLKGLTDVMYVNFVGDYLALTGDAELFSVAKGFVEKTVVPLKVANLLDVYVPVENIVGMFGGQVDAFVAEFKGQIEKAAKVDPDLAPLSSYMSSSFLKIIQIVKELKTFTFSVQVDGGQVTLPMSFTYAPGGKLSKMGASMESRGISAIQRMPEGSYLVMGLNIDPSFFKGYLSMVSEMYGEMFKWSPELKKEFVSLLGSLMDLSAGEQVSALYSEGDYPVNMISVYGHKDKKKLMAGMDELWSFLFSHIVANALEIAKAEGAPADLEVKSFDDVIKLINQFGASVGIKASTSEETYKDTVFSKLVVTVDWKKVMAQSPEDEIVQIVKLFLGNKLEMVMGYGDKLAYFGMGPDVMPRLKKVVDGEESLPKNAVFQGTFGSGAESRQGLLFISPMSAIKEMAHMPFLAPYKAKVDAAQAKKGVGISFGMGKSTAHFSIDLPLDEFSALTKIFQ